MATAAKAYSAAVKRYPSGHRLSRADYERGHIGCSDCNKYRARYCEYSRYALPTRPATKGISFWYYCELCWEKPNHNGVTPKQRALKEVA